MPEQVDSLVPMTRASRAQILSKWGKIWIDPKRQKDLLRILRQLAVEELQELLASLDQQSTTPKHLDVPLKHFAIKTASGLISSGEMTKREKSFR